MKGSNIISKHAEDEISTWVEWMIINPELAEKYFPEKMQSIYERCFQWPPHKSALITQMLPRHFSKWRTQVDEAFGVGKIKMLNDIILIIQTKLGRDYDNEIEQQALESVRDELSEQLEYWKMQLDELLSTSTNKAKEPPIANSELVVLPTNNLIEIMLPPCQSRFIELEKKLIEKGYFGEYGQWKESTLSLAAFIYILREDKNLIKPNIASYVPLRKFFNKRYKVEIPVDYTKPGRMKPGKNSKIKELLSLLKG